MNLLYISNCTSNVDSGLNWSVPASISAQQRYDNILWVNLNKNANLPHWNKVEAYHNIYEYGKRIKLDILPPPFNKPDCVIFEGFYFFDQLQFSKELVYNKIPYIIIPRGSLTKQAFHNGTFLKYLKKKIAHWLFFDSYLNNAKAIQYLTTEERIESEKTFNLKSFVIPNGISLPSTYKVDFSNGIKGVFVGRQDIYQKGLDLLLDAISLLHDELREVGFTLDIYGPPRYDYKQVSEIIKVKNIGDLVVNHERGIQGKEKENILINSDVFFLTSRFEGHPMGLIEALSYGLPVLITQGANMREEVDEYYAGWTCETTIEGITKALKDMITDKNNYLEIGSNARRLATKYDWDLLAQQLHNILSENLNNML